MDVIAKFAEAIKLRWVPMYRAGIATTAALIFGLLPVLFAWARFALHGKFLEQYASTFSDGNALMIASSLAGPALILAFRKRDPETIGAPEVFGIVGVCLVIACIVIFEEAFPIDPVHAGNIEQQRIIICTYILLPLCTLYALLISYFDERSTSLREFNRQLDTNGTKLSISFPAREQ